MTFKKKKLNQLGNFCQTNPSTETKSLSFRHRSIRSSQILKHNQFLYKLNNLNKMIVVLIS